MSADDETTDGAELERLVAEVERESARVGVDWNVASPRLRARAFERQPMTPDESSEVTLGLDVSRLARTLRALPTGAGTEAFLAAFDDGDPGPDPDSK